MFDYSSNSNRNKQDSENRQKKHESVVSKKPVIKTRKGFGRLVDRLNLNNIGSHILEEYIVPSIGKTLVDTISYIFDLKQGSSRGSYSGASYRNYYESNRGGRSRDRDDEKDADDNSIYKYRNLTFDFRQDALAVIDAMQDVLDEYDAVSVADLYDIAGVSSNNWTNNKYGWTNLDTAEVAHARGGGYKLVLPKARPLD